MKNKLFVIAIAALVLATLAAGSLAYFSDEATTHNVITSGGVTIELREWADEAKTKPFPKEGLDGMMPGMSATKIVEVENTGAATAWIRVHVDPLFDDDEAYNPDHIGIDYNDDDWTLDEDGIWWYYNAPVAPGEVTEQLFTTVSFDAAMGNDYQNRTLTVTVSAEAVQTANNGESALDAAGWPSAE